MASRKTRAEIAQQPDTIEAGSMAWGVWWVCGV